VDSPEPALTAVVDTNVVAYYVLQTEPYVNAATRFLAQGVSLLAPATWESELANVVWFAVRKGVLQAEEGLGRLHSAGDLAIEGVAVHELCLGALKRSLESGVAVYDTLFVELAHQRQVPLVTFDQQVLEAFPTIACAPGALLESSQ